MSDITYVGTNASTLDIAPELDKITRVVVICDENTTYTAGNDTGRTLTVTIPWGSQQIAADILARMKNSAYQPYTASGANVNPAAELGDAVSIRGAYGGIFSQRTTFGKQLRSDVSAPFEAEIDHEFPYQPTNKKTVERKMRSISSRLTVLASEITAEVEERTEENRKINSQLSVIPGQISAKVSAQQEGSFGWNLQPSSWTLTSGSKTVLSATKDGIEVTGKITATSGTIGGFDILKNYISSNGQTWGGTNSTGIYIGTSGIQMGTDFKVTNSGKITATGGEFSGTIKCDALYVKNADGGYDKITTSSMSRSLSGGAAYSSSGWGNYSPSSMWGGASWGYSYGNATSRTSNAYPQFFRADVLHCTALEATNIIRNNLKLSSKYVTIGGSSFLVATWV